MTDTADVGDIFPSQFTTLSSEEASQNWKNKLSEAITAHKALHPKNFLKKKLRHSFLVDFTEILGPYIKTEGDTLKEKVFEQKMAQAKKELKKIIREVAHGNNALKLFIKKHITPIVRVDFEGYGGIKVLPLFKTLNGIGSLATHHSTFHKFVDSAGLFIGAVNFRRHLLNGFAVRPDIKYVPQGANKIYFARSFDFVLTESFTRLSEKFSKEEYKKRLSLHFNSG